MATTFVDYTGDGNATKSFSFPSIKEADIKVDVDGVTKTSGNHYNITSYTTTGGGNVVFTSGNIPASPASIRIRRDTDVDSPKATFTAGSSVKAGDLNNNMTQILYAAQEEQNQTVVTSDIKDGAITTAKIQADAITGAKIADDQISTEHYANTSIRREHIAAGEVIREKLEADAVDSTKLADNSVNSEHYVDGSIDTEHIADLNVTTAKIAADAITSAKIADDQINSEHYVDGSIDTAHIADSQITSAKIADGTIVAGDLASNSVTTAKITDANVTTAKIAADAVTNAKIADDSIDSDHYVDGSIDTAHIGGAQVTDAKLASNSVITSKITDANVTTVKIADSNVTLAKLASDLKQTTISDSDTQLPTSGAVVDYVAAQIAPIGGLEVIATEVAFPNTQPQAGVVISISDAQGVVVSGSGSSTTGRTVGGSTVTINNFPSSLNSETLAAGVGLMVSSTGSSQIYNYHKLLAAETDVKQLSDDINDFNARYRVGSSNPTSALDGGDLFFNTGSGKLLVYNNTQSAWEEAQSIGQYFINTISSYSGTGGNSASFNGSAYRFVLSDPGTVAEQHIVSVNGVVQKPNSGTSQPSEGFAIDGSSIIFSSAPPSGADFFIITIGSTVNIGTPSDGTVSTSKLASGAVTTAKIADLNVTTAKIASNAITTGTIMGSAVTTAKIADDAVTGAKLAPEIDNSHITSSANIAGSKLADDSISLAKLEHGTSSNDGKFLRANNGADPTFETVNSDLVGDTSPQLGGDLASNNNNILFADSNAVKNMARFGDSSDLQIYHDGSNSYIKDSGTGNLIITGSAVNILNAAANESMIRATENGAVELYHDNVKICETDPNGIKLQGPEGGDAEVNLFADEGDDNADKWRIQALAAGGFNIQNFTSGSWEDNLKATGDGAVELYYDNSKKFETTSSGITVTGSINASGLSKASGNMFINNNDTSNGIITFATNTNDRWKIDFSGHFVPANNNDVNIGSSSKRVANIYTNDLHLSNVGHTNDVDGTWGDWTIQEGESDLFLKNNRSGKKYKFNLTEVS